MKAITTQHIRTHGFSDAETFKVTFGLLYLKSPSMRTAQSKFLSSNNPTRGGHSPESIDRMKQNRRGKGIGVAGKYERTPAIRDKIAEGVLRAWEEGKRGRGKYVYGRKAGRKVWVRSSWEERVVHILDAHPSILGYEVEPFQIPYQFEGRTHRYTPDFLVTTEGGIRELWEVKPQELVGKPKNTAKLAALNQYVHDHPVNARVVTLRDIEVMEMQAGLSSPVSRVVTVRRSI